MEFEFLEVFLPSNLNDLRRVKSELLLTQLKCVHTSLEKVESPEAIDELDCSWKLREKAFPYSCTDEEGLILNYVIAANQLKSGFEISTAFGFSSMYIGLALKQNGGQLVTMDCYVEEWKESFVYNPEEMESSVECNRKNALENILPTGLRFAKESANKLGLSDVIRFEIGISPKDVPTIVGDRKLDFVFIDGGHFGEQPLLDFLAVYPYLSEKCAVFFHDNHSGTTVAQAVSEAENKLGASAQKLLTRWNLTLVSRGLNKLSLATLDYLLIRKHPSYLELSQTQLQQAQDELKRSQTQLQYTQSELELSKTQLQHTQGELKLSQTQLQHTQGELELSQTQLQHTQGELKLSQTQLQHTQGELKLSQTQLQHTQGELKLSQTQLQHTQGELEIVRYKADQTEAMISAMQSSKFWKLRRLWLKLKKNLGLVKEVQE
ncbi:MAG: class I SAM-dependent methyltransferase [Komarekiella atlantica HA4396-MV6]|jgi:predicted O-methyltransferase YrrM|nr:class I SAM-dependent methyltransferase [Komarekiella atlantica HA4396-MV6]